PKLGANINLGCFYLVGMPVAVWLSFVAGFDFKGLWFGLLAAQGSCMVTMLFVLFRTNWENQVERAKDLTSSDPSEEDEQEEEKGFVSSCDIKECSNSLV
ncbi:Protein DETOXIFICATION 49, partial [Lathyrus oleraceus]